MIDICLYQPDIPQNTATIIRFGACLDLVVHIIEPTGFVWSDRSFRRAGMDYLDHATVHRHATWAACRTALEGRRIVLLTTRATQPHCDFTFRSGDVLLMGRESAGVPEHIHDEVDCRLKIPMRQDLRSLNIAMACALAAGEALRQLDGFPRTG